jgi:tetratricopeptide (TPR) repeat protein
VKRALVLLAFSLPAAALARDGRSAAAPTYLVMPFENVAEDRSLEWLSTGLALAMSESILGHGAKVVDEEDRAVLLEGNGLPAGATPTLATALELGRKMRARGGPRPDRLLIGRFTVTGGDLTLAARSIDLAGDKARPWISRRGPLKSLLEVQGGLAEALAHDVGLAAGKGPPEGAGEKDGQVPLLAFETYCRGMAETDTHKRLQILRRAVEEYPGYPRAAYQAASLLVREERWDEASEMLARIGTDPHPYETDFYLLKAAVGLEKRDPGAAAAAARRALALTDTARGHALLGRALFATGDRPQAEAELQKAATLDPSEPENDDLRRALAEGPRPARRNP